MDSLSRVYKPWNELANSENRLHETNSYKQKNTVGSMVSILDGCSMRTYGVNQAFRFDGGVLASSNESSNL